MFNFGFFDSINGDRKYNSDNFADYFEGIVGDGIYANVGNGFKISASGDGMNITVHTGRAKILNRYARNTTPFTKEIATSDTDNPRWDAVTVKANLANRDCSVDILTGTPAENPEKPTPTNTETAKSFVLAYIYVPAKATEITDSNVSDNRGAENCPWVVGVTGTENIVDTIQNYIDDNKSKIDDFIKNGSDAVANFNDTANSTIDTYNQTFADTMDGYTEKIDTFIKSETDSVEELETSLQGKIDDIIAQFKSWWADETAQPYKLTTNSYILVADTDGQTDFTLPNGVTIDTEKTKMDIYKNGLHLNVLSDYGIETKNNKTNILIVNGTQKGDAITCVATEVQKDA
jgi:hypothetical protein